jgi:protein required for attachment to host cells
MATGADTQRRADDGRQSVPVAAPLRRRAGTGQNNENVEEQHMKPVRTWILIADAGRARVLENLGPGKGTRPVSGLESVSTLPDSTHDIVSDRQGRSFESSGATRHPLEPRTDPREQVKRNYLEMLAGQLEERLQAGAFDRLVVVAPPQALGMLRGAFSDHVKAVVTGELAKDLTKIPDHDLASHLEDHVRL